MPLTTGQRITAILSTVTLVILWQHFGRIFSFTYRPSWFIDQFALAVEHVARWFGRVAAILSSYFEILKLEELTLSIVEILSSFWGVVVAGFAFFASYFDTIAEYAWNPKFVIAGSIVLLFFLALMIVYNIFGIRQRSRALYHRAKGLVVLLISLIPGLSTPAAQPAHEE